MQEDASGSRTENTASWAEWLTHTERVMLQAQSSGSAILCTEDGQRFAAIAHASYMEQGHTGPHARFSSCDLGGCSPQVQEAARADGALIVHYTVPAIVLLASDASARLVARHGPFRPSAHAGPPRVRDVPWAALLAAPRRAVDIAQHHPVVVTRDQERCGVLVNTTGYMSTGRTCQPGSLDTRALRRHSASLPAMLSQGPVRLAFHRGGADAVLMNLPTYNDIVTTAGSDRFFGAAGAPEAPDEPVLSWTQLKSQPRVAIGRVRDEGPLPVEWEHVRAYMLVHEVHREPLGIEAPGVSVGLRQLARQPKVVQEHLARHAVGLIGRCDRVAVLVPMDAYRQQVPAGHQACTSPPAAASATGGAGADADTCWHWSRFQQQVRQAVVAARRLTHVTVTLRNEALYRLVAMRDDTPAPQGLLPLKEAGNRRTLEARLQHGGPLLLTDNGASTHVLLMPACAQVGGVARRGA